MLFLATTMDFLVSSLLFLGQNCLALHLLLSDGAVALNDLHGLLGVLCRRPRLCFSLLLGLHVPLLRHGLLFMLFCYFLGLVFHYMQYCFLIYNWFLMSIVN